MICGVIGLRCPSLHGGEWRPTLSNEPIAELRVLGAVHMPGTSLQKAMREGVSQEFLPHIHGRGRNRRRGESARARP
jgi:hypothetical protein